MSNQNASSFVNSLLSLKIGNTQGNAVPGQLANGQLVFNGQPLCNQPVIGCMDKSAVNYDPNATQDSGHCERKRYGCTDSKAYNYNPRANVSFEGACFYAAPKSGCTDPSAVNYLPSAQADDGSCIARRTGCTNLYAVNYDPSANTNDGSCRPFVVGCTDPKARNFDASATVDSGGCWYPRAGCMNRGSPSFDWRAQVPKPGSCCTAKSTQSCGQRPLAAGVPVPCDSCCDAK